MQTTLTPIMRTSLILNRVGRFEVEAGLTILEASKQLGLYHPDHCGGQAECTTCAVWLIAGHQNCTPVAEKEAALLAAHHMDRNVRLGCQAKIAGPVRAHVMARDELDLKLALERSSSPNPPLPGTEMPLAILYALISNFDDFEAENLPTDTINVLDRFHLIVQRLLAEQGGELVWSDGPELIGIFGRQGNVRAAIADALGCARRMVVEFRQVNDYVQRHFDLKLQLGVGVHAGKTVLGQIGQGASQRMVIAGNTNLTAKQLAYHTQEARAAILISEPVFAVVRDRFPITRAFSARLQGEEERRNVFEVQVESTGYVVLEKAGSGTK